MNTKTLDSRNLFWWSMGSGTTFLFLWLSKNIFIIQNNWDTILLMSVILFVISLVSYFRSLKIERSQNVHEVQKG